MLVHDKHLLSLKDMNRTADLEAMMDAGVRSFKIEGRLKDTNYVKNVTAWYRQQIDKILAQRADTYVRASYGTSHLTFEPDAKRSFNRGFTNYFLYGRTDAPIHSFATPKAIGPVVGKVDASSAAALCLNPTPTLPRHSQRATDCALLTPTASCKASALTKLRATWHFPPPCHR